MPTVVDALVVTLGLDATAFKKGMADVNKSLKDTRDDAGRTGKEMEARGKQAGAFFGSIKNEAIGLFATLLGSAGVIQFARTATAELSALGRAALNIGVSAQDLMAFKNAVAANGGSADQAAASFQGLADAMQRWKTLGQLSGSMMGAMSTIGGRADDTAMDIYRKFAEYADRNKGNRQQNRLIGQLLGLDEGSINLALQGLSKVDKELADAKRRGVPTDQEVAQVQAFAKAQTALGQALAGVGNKIFAAAAPGLTKLLELITEGIEKNPQLAATITMIGTALTTLAALRLPLWLLGILGGTGAASTGAAAAGAGWLAALSRILGPLALVGIAGAAGYKAATDGDFWQRWGTAFSSGKFKWGDSSGETPSLLGSAFRWFFGGRTEGGGAGGAGGGGGGAGANPRTPRTTLPTGPVSDRERAAHDYFRAQGWSEEQTAGILTYLKEESGFRPREYNPAGGGDGARGMGQWRGPRIKRFVDAYGHKPDDPNIPEDQLFREQLAFLQWELNNTHAGAGQSLRNARTATDAGNVILREFGIPGPEDQARRLNSPASENYLRRFRDTPALRSPTGGNGLLGSLSQPSFSVGQIVVNTQATDAPGIARDIGDELARTATVTMANTGLA